MQLLMRYGWPWDDLKDSFEAIALTSNGGQQMLFVATENKCGDDVMILVGF